VVPSGSLKKCLPIKEGLGGRGHSLKSGRGPEVVAHLVVSHVTAAGSLAEAVRRALGELRGAFAVGVISDREPDTIVTAKTGAGGVVIGLGDGEYFVASDIPAILQHTRDVVVLEDGERGVGRRGGVLLPARGGGRGGRPVAGLVGDPIGAERGGSRHFMLKEIYEQPRAITDTFRGRISPETGDCFLPDLDLTADEL